MNTDAKKGDTGKRGAALVTGSSSGIGLAIAMALADEGYSVAFNGRREAGRVEEPLREAERRNGRPGSCFYLRGDVAEEKDRRMMAEALRERFGRLDVLVNNAGISSQRRADMLELTEENILKVMKVNLVGPFLLTAALVPLMTPREKTGYIINISSISAYIASTTRADYCMSKAGMSMMTGLYALRLAGEGVRSFEIRPGIIRTEMTRPSWEKYDALIAEGLLPLARWGEPEDIAGAVRAVVRGHHDYTTGEIINVDGGYHLRGL